MTFVFPEGVDCTRYCEPSHLFGATLSLVRFLFPGGLLLRSSSPRINKAAANWVLPGT